jgi:hypothetical protein
MRFSFYFPSISSLVILIAGCQYNSDENVNIRAVSSQQETGSTSNYSSLKQKCRKIYADVKQFHTKENEKKFFSFIADSLLRCWYGTKWDFNGTSETPGTGTIACGYFVTTVVRDAGIPINRIKLAQCASEEMIKTICVSTSIKRYSNVGINKVLDEVRKSGFGLFVVGLDNHTGFIFNNEKEIFFIHSTFVTPSCVIKEKAFESSILIQSKYKVIGKLKI